MSFLVNSYRYAQSGFDFGNSLQFDGVNDDVRIAAMPTGNVWTFVGWFYLDTDNDVKYFFGGSNATRFLRIEANDYQFRFRIGATNLLWTWPVGTMNKDQWHSVVATMNVGKANFYIDGVVSPQGERTYVTDSMTFRYLGRRDTAGDNFQGRMDECAFYHNVVWTAQNAIDFHNGGNGISAPDVVANPTGHWDFNQSGSSTSLPDVSGNGKNGTLYNFPASGMWVPH